jgi:acetyl esterase/lipase
MNRETIDLWPEGVPGTRRETEEETSRASPAGELVSGVQRPLLTVWRPPAGTANGTGVVICPGGGYTVLAVELEGTEVARWLNGLGVTAFVLRYRLKGWGHPAPLRDALRALRLVRSRAEEFGVRADRLGILGFSAGGHLAASASTLYDDAEGRTGARLDAVSARPDFTVLLYPVISLAAAPAHRGSRLNLLGSDPDPALLEKLSPERQVTAATPPAFLMHTAVDPTVPAENSVLYHEALRAAGVPAELRIYAQGPHGVGLRPEHEAGRLWPAACAAWLKERGFLPQG